MEIDERFRFFDPKQEFAVTYGKLPHWEQDGVTYFITFRTADSLPSSVMRLWERQRDDWLRRHGVEPGRNDWHVAFERLAEATQQEFHRMFAAKLEGYLDECHGECLLKRPALAKIVADALTHFDGVRYHLGEFVVMPNHVHVLVCFSPRVRMLKQCYSWKHYTSGQINRALGRSGEFWQKESFDHLVRDADHFARFDTYILDNPRKANLKAGEFHHYRCPDL